jgi:deoxyribose-phosphate aldolase
MSDTASTIPTQPVETYESLASRIDLPLLEPTLTSEQVADGCRLARALGVRAVVLRPCDVELAAQWISGSRVVVASVAGWPEGTTTTAAKLYEARDVLRLGATEVEFVLNPARVVSRQFQHVETELLQIAKSCHESGARLTVVFNNRWMADDLKIIASKICKRVEADTIALDDSDADFKLIRPLVRDLVQLKRVTPAVSLDDAVAARGLGYSSFNTQGPSAILDAWKARIAPSPPTQS